MNNLQHSFHTLKSIGLVSTWDDFSVRWLLMCPSYSRNLNSRGEDLPVTAMSNLISRLHQTSMALSESAVGKLTAEDLTHLRDHLSSELYVKSLSSKSST